MWYEKLTFEFNKGLKGAVESKDLNRVRELLFPGDSGISDISLLVKTIKLGKI